MNHCKIRTVISDIFFFNYKQYVQITTCLEYILVHTTSTMWRKIKQYNSLLLLPSNKSTSDLFLHAQFTPLHDLLDGAHKVSVKTVQVPFSP